ncbi:class II aldolase/adducin family protein [Magnetospirillum fulvum]|uniref:class II aldolase/adducin family protein n=1 Tax=Magnetospirillum fulvum TaxID=1082 RepID=UPI0004172451|nr:class II aldolase/adducin family protein [Magnetospirillum fulvum]
MKSLWSPAEAEHLVAQWSAQGIDAELALSVYATRLLGGDPTLVLHGGGNSSVKATQPDLLGEPVAVLHIKGSGRDMAVIDPEGLPPVRLDALRALRRLESLSDPEMVDVLGLNRLKSNSPAPSVETLMHAFLPQRHVLHTHATAVLALTNQPDGAAICREVFGPRVGVVPYMMSGFALARAVAETYEADPTVEGLVLLKHGLVTFGDDAATAYQRMIDLVTLAEQRLAQGRRSVVPVAGLVADPVPAAALAPRLRGLLARDKGDGAFERWLLDLRDDEAARALSADAGLILAIGRGVATPDHVIRTKSWPLVLPPPPRAPTSMPGPRPPAPRSKSLNRATTITSSPITTPRAADESNSTRSPASRSSPASACSESEPPPPPQRSPPTWRWPPLPAPPPPKASAATPPPPKPTCSTLNIGRWNRPSWVAASTRNVRWPGR